jgi:hypothetical protein
MTEAGMRGLASLAGAALVSCSARTSAPVAPSPSGCPTVVVRAVIPFPPIADFDAPIFVLYPGGIALYGSLGNDNLTPTFRIARLTVPQQSALLDSVKVSFLLPPGSEYRDTSHLGLTDQVGYTVDANIEGVHRRESYTGALPPPIRYLYLGRFSAPRAVPWLPDSFQVVLHLDPTLAHTRAAEQAKRWPSGWPGLSSAKVSPTDPGARLLTLPRSDFATLQRLRPQRVPWIAIEGQLAILGYRIPFPCETWWQADSV